MEDEEADNCETGCSGRKALAVSKHCLGESEAFRRRLLQ